jgi:hypothetical protein
MTINYANLPPQPSANGNSTLQAFANYFSIPIQMDAGTLDAITGFFTSRGFETIGAQSIAVLIIAQAKKDGYNPLQILDTLKGLDNVQLSALVAEIVNYNRYKTSFLGQGNISTPNTEVSRNVLP